MSYKYDVFLSYKSCDQEWVVKLKNALVKAGIKVWLDKDEIRPGDLFAEAIEEGLKSSETIAIIVSPEAMNSGWVKAEYYRAVSLAIKENPPQRIIPLLLCDAELPGFLKDRQWVDFRDENRFEIRLQKLIWGIQGESKEQFDKSSKTIKAIEEELKKERSVHLHEKKKYEALVNHVKWGITSIIWIFIAMALISIPWSGLEWGIKILVACVAVFGFLMAPVIPLGWGEIFKLIVMIGAVAHIVALISYLIAQHLA